ncbi:MAG: hypothetical protein LBU17_00620 [Treponema sp.]|jgi:hypothetical protein|nr:hypothetical protein [Treponema sp.]
MKIIQVHPLENCLEGDFVYHYVFDCPWTQETILLMQDLGTLQYYETFPKPMFRVTCPDGTIIKGVQTTPTCRVIFPKTGIAAARKRFEERYNPELLVY